MNVIITEREREQFAIPYRKKDLETQCLDRSAFPVDEMRCLEVVPIGQASLMEARLKECQQVRLCWKRDDRKVHREALLETVSAGSLRGYAVFGDFLKKILPDALQSSLIRPKNCLCQNSSSWLS
jgi:hypothetical protein